jgi:signal peptidase I
MTEYNLKYKPFINDKNIILPQKMERNKFYLIKEYKYTDGDKVIYRDMEAPIIYTLFVSKPKDVIHCVKVSNVNPNIVKRMFGKLYNEQTEKLEIKGSARNTYNTSVKKIPSINNNAYRTYKLSGIIRILELKMEVEKIVPKSKLIQKAKPKPKVEPKSKK